MARQIKIRKSYRMNYENREKIVKEVLHKLNSQIRKYFRNRLSNLSGYSSKEIGNLTGKKALDFLRQMFILTLYWSNQRADYIDKALVSFNNFIKHLVDKRDWKSIEKLSSHMEEYWNNKNKQYKDDSNNFIKLSRGLSKFHSMGFKSAALFLRFLTVDSNFLKGFNKKDSLPPLDRVNCRTLVSIFGDKKVKRRLEKYKNGDKIKGQFKEDQQLKFYEWGKELFPNQPSLIDNLWFIGHFYCDGSNGKKGKLRAYRYIDRPWLKGVKLSEECPFKFKDKKVCNENC